MVMERHNNQLPTNLPQLQNLIKRDPASYHEEFQLQYHHYKALLEVFVLNPSQESKSLHDLIMFLAQVCHCYPEDMKGYPEELQLMLKQQAGVFHPDVRMVMCKALMLMRNKNIIPPESLLGLFFELFRCHDKLLRSTLYSHIIADIKRINSKHKNNKVNKMLQNFMYEMLNDSNNVAARTSLDVMLELYRRNIWNDSKTVNVVASACLSSKSQIMVSALKFFLTEESNSPNDDSSDDESEGSALRNMIVTKQTNKGKKRERKIEKALQVLKKQKKKHKPSPQASFAALYLINDPQDFSEKLFKRLETSREKFEVRLLLLNLISRLIGVHKLFLFNFYPLIQRYLMPSQREVTRLLSFLAQSCHELVPAEIIEPVLRAVVDNFISERNSSEAIAVGLNTVRELCSRCPLAMSADLLQDLTSYKKYRDKSVMMASRSLIQLYRTVNPSLLARRDKGRPSSDGVHTATKYGESKPFESVPGTDQPADQEILTQEDFEAIRLKQAVNEADPSAKGRKRQLESLNESQSPEELVSLSQIESLAKRQKMDKGERLESIKAGREGRDQFVFKKKRLNPNSSTSNKEKQKNKDFRMVKQKRSIRSKTKRSFREKQISLKHALVKRMRNQK